MLSVRDLIQSLLDTLKTQGLLNLLADARVSRIGRGSWALNNPLEN